ncbi:hypothetical protein [Radiobacillus sp. PE A8.2]|uniref:hypothetical protein n=1 Tax=Radiobacillus sp. PE A8.2 TaxID=3380349 RepID=UPI00388D35F4
MNKLLFKTVIGIILLMVISLVLKEYKVVLNYSGEGMILYGLLISFLYLLFGILIESEKVKKIIALKKVKVDCAKAVLTLILIIFSTIPFGSWILWFGIDGFNAINPLRSLEIRAIMGVLAGILLVRSLSEN